MRRLFMRLSLMLCRCDALDNYTTYINLVLVPGEFFKDSE